MMVLTVLIITFFLPKQPRFRYEFQKGKVWLNKDLVSPFSFAILKTNPQVTTDKQDALENVLPIYRYSPELYTAVEEAYMNEFDVKWRGNAFPEEEKNPNKIASLKLLKKAFMRKGLLRLTLSTRKAGNITTYHYSTIISRKRSAHRMFLLYKLR
ncbi:hypothetical protein [Pedobacter sp. NJ-S-72]